MARSCQKNDIFVPVDFDNITLEMMRGNFEMIIGAGTKSKPSIETLLHILMPHRFVVHLHAIEPLAFLVRKNCEHKIKNIVRDIFRYVVVDYHKPGAQLAKALYWKIKGIRNGVVDVAFLKNHGIVVGGDDIMRCDALIKRIQELFQAPVLPAVTVPNKAKSMKLSEFDYNFLEDQDLQQLVFNKALFKRLSRDWALYPDHVVFLGKRAYVYEKGGQPPDPSANIVFVGETGCVHKTSVESIRI